MALPNHATQTDPYLHEPKGISAATANTVYVADGAGSGSWTTAPSSVGATGSIVQKVYTQTASVVTGATMIPFDNSIPQITEGDEYLSLVVAPSYTTSTLVFDAKVVGSLSVTGTVSAALFQSGVTAGLAAASETVDANQITTLSLRYLVTAGATASTTYSLRIGGSTTGTFTLNGASATGIFGGVSQSSMTIEEIK